MTNLQELIEKVKLEANKKNKFIELEVTNGNFKGDKIIDYKLPFSLFQDSTLKNVKFKNVRLSGSSFENCTFENCIFDDCILLDTTFASCNFKTCQFLDSIFKSSDFNKVIFTNCNFLKNSLAKVWFESCEFINTEIETSDSFDLVQTVIANSTFGKSDKSITFNGEFFLINILLPSNKLEDVLS